ncbi:MAG TPA: hypothetical protein VFD92_12410 [Candidatus Binatia bacterium]|nr:hypothetical protein [Candidatus Binatia bacterium]
MCCCIEVMRCDGRIRIRHRGELVATHEILTGKCRMRINPAHGPGAEARNARQRRSTPWLVALDARDGHPDVEIRDLAVYDTLAAPAIEVQP